LGARTALSLPSPPRTFRKSCTAVLRCTVVPGTMTCALCALGTVSHRGKPPGHLVQSLILYANVRRSKHEVAAEGDTGDTGEGIDPEFGEPNA
jgi:hypothetical protein